MIDLTMKQKDSRWRIGPAYCLVVKSTCNKLAKESKVFLPKECGYHIYENPESQVIGIYEHPKHIEPLLTIATYFHTKEMVSKCFVGAQLTISDTIKDTSKIEDTFNLIIAPSLQIHELNTLGSMKVLSKMIIFKLLGDIMIILYPSREWKHLEDKLSHSKLQERILGLSLIAYRKFQPMATKHPYRPIVGRSNEMRNQVIYLENSGRKLLYTLRSLSNEYRTTDTLKIESNVKEILNNVDNVNYQMSTINVTDLTPKVFDRIESLEGVLAECQKSLSIMENALQQRLLFKANNQKYSLKIHGEIDLLKCFELSIADFFKTVDDIPINPLVVIDEEGPRTYFWGLSKNYCFGIPSRFLYRLGLVPSLAHEVAHRFLYLFLEKRQEHPIFSIFLDLEGSLHRYVNVDHRSALIAVNEMLADLLSLLIAGPSYLYALARLTYRSSEETLSEQQYTTHFPVSIRLLTMLEALKKLNITSRMHLPLTLAKDSFSQGLLEFAMHSSSILKDFTKAGIVMHPYNSLEHKIATGKAKISLKRGEVISNRPTIVLNALWDSVFDTQGYANESAVVFSILGQKL